MRSLPEAKGAMALLLSEIVLHLHNQGNYTYFDLGFVPLSNKHKDTDNSAQTLLRKAVRPVYSIEGLEQFKSKFDPAWHAKYIAWDGDKLLVPQMTTALLRALSK
jgi:phosphatidylglycerol lysyltransferase